MGACGWCSRNYLVGLPGFEPGTSSSRTKRATKLRYSPQRVSPRLDNPSRAARGHTKAHSGSVTDVTGSWNSTTTSLMRRLATDWTRKLQSPWV